MKEVTGRSRNHQHENRTHAYDYHRLYNPNHLAEPCARANDHGCHASCSEPHEARQPWSRLILNGRQIDPISESKSEYRDWFGTKHAGNSEIQTKYKSQAWKPRGEAFSYLSIPNHFEPAEPPRTDFKPSKQPNLRLRISLVLE